MKNRPHALNSLLATAVFASAFGFAPLAHAQTTNTWIGGNTTNNWSTGTNWSTGVSPNETNATIAFTSASSTAWTNATNIVGTILASGGTVVIGNTTSSTSNGLILATSSGKPIISNASTIFMYTDLQGTNGFTKLGSGELTFRFNTRALTYTGDINLNAGTLTINQDGSLGDTNNDITVGGNSTLSYSPGSNTGAGSLSAGRNISISNGTTLTLQTLNTNTPLTINGVISNAGALTFVGAGAGSNVATSLSYTLNGVNTYTGQTTIQGGARVTLGSGAALGTGSLTLANSPGTTNPSFTLLNLGGNSQSVATLTVNSSTTNVRTLVISNGSLDVTNPASAFSFNGTNGTSLDMSGLTSFRFDGAPGGRNITIQPNISTGAEFNTNYVYLATNGMGSNSITAGAILVGAASGGSAGSGNEARLLLGKINEIGATSFTIGGFNGSGVVAFGAGISGGSVRLTGSNGIARMGLLVVGETSSGTRRGFGTLDLGTANASISNAYVGVFGANSVANLTLTNQITMAAGTFDALNLYLGAVTNISIVSSSITNISIFQQNGGTNTIGLLRMGDDKSTAASDTLAFQSSYNLVGANAVLKAQTIDAGTNAVFGANASRTLRMSNDATLRNASGVDLSVTGFNNTAAGRMNIALDGNGTVEADSGRSVTFGANTRLSGAGNLTKTGAGTLILSSGIAGANTGALNISNGVVQLNATGVAAAGTVTSVAVGSGATLLISQSDQVNNSAAVTLSGGTIARAGGVSETFGTLTLTGNSFLNFGGVSEAANLTFGVLSLGGYNVSVSGFALNNQLKYAAASEASGLSLLSSFSFDNSYTTSFSTGTFTITAIPEPSTYLAAAGLLGLMLWSARRRLLKEAQAMLGRPLVRRP